MALLAGYPRYILDPLVLPLTVEAVISKGLCLKTILLIYFRPIKTNPVNMTESQQTRRHSPTEGRVKVRISHICNEGIDANHTESVIFFINFQSLPLDPIYVCMKTTRTPRRRNNGNNPGVVITNKMPVRYNLSSVWIRLSIFSQLSIIQYVGLCVFSLPISFVTIERIYIHCLIIIIKSEVWTITHCLGLGHETMVCAVCLSIFLFLSQLN